MSALMAALEDQEKENKKLLESAHERAQAVEKIVDRQNHVIQELEQRVAEIKEKQPQGPVQVHVPGRQPVVLNERTHQSFTEALELAGLHRQVYLYGPSGSGKTFLGEQLAKALTLPFAHISCSAGMSEGHLLGRMLADGSYLPADFVKFYEHGGVFLLDEVDAADANLLLVINSALSNGHLSVPNRVHQPVAKRHEDFVCLLAANTLGNGSFEYHGRYQMDAAFMDRFVLSKVVVDYDVELEKTLLGSDSKSAEMLHKLRVNVQLNALRRTVSTRVFVQAAQLLSVGKTPQQVLDKLFIGWTDEEKQKALKNVTVPASSPLKAEAEKRRKQAEAEAKKAAKAEQKDTGNSKLKAALASIEQGPAASLVARGLPDPKTIVRPRREEPEEVTGSIWDDLGERKSQSSLPLFKALPQSQEFDEPAVLDTELEAEPAPIESAPDLSWLEEDVVAEPVTEDEAYEYEELDEKVPF